jgi:ankyrin repeat protein
MHGAAFTGRTDIMEFLYRHGAKIDSTAKFGVTPLYEAHQYHQVEAEKWLIDHGASTNFYNINEP